MLKMKKYQLVALRDAIKNNPCRDRDLLVAYGLLRGKTYRQIEPRTRDTLDRALHGAGESITRIALVRGVVQAVKAYGGLTEERAVELAAQVRNPAPDAPLPVLTDEQKAERKLRAEKLRAEGVASKEVA